MRRMIGREVDGCWFIDVGRLVDGGFMQWRMMDDRACAEHRNPEDWRVDERRQTEDRRSPLSRSSATKKP